MKLWCRVGVMVGLLSTLALSARSEEYVNLNCTRLTANQANFYGSVPLQIQGTNVTASAAELNIMDGVTVSASQINAAGGGTTATLAPTTLTVSGVTTMGKQVNTPQVFTTTAGARTLTVTNAIVFVGGHSGIVTMTLANASSPGMEVTIINTVGTNVVIEEVSGRVEMPAAWGSITNGILDTISFTSYTTNWVCTGFSDN